MKISTTCSRSLNGGECLVALMSGQFAWNLRCPLHQLATRRLGARRRIVFKANCTQFLWAEGRKTNDPPTVDRQVLQLFGFLFLRPRASKTSWKRQRTRVAKLSLPGPTTATNLSWEQGVTKPQQRGVERRNFACTLACAATALRRRTWSIDQSIDRHSQPFHSVTCVRLARDCSPTGPRENSCRNQLFLRPACHDKGSKTENNRLNVRLPRPPSHQKRNQIYTKNYWK